jgi:endoglucanase
MRNESLELLEQLTNTPAPGGHESAVQRIWLDYVKPYADEIYTDAYGNAAAILNPEGSPRVMIDGHCDEICMVIKHIDDKGFVYVQAFGGIVVSTLKTKRVNIHTQKGIVRGVFESVPKWIRNGKGEDKTPENIYETWIDIGAKDGKDAQKKVAVGDMVTFEEKFELLNRNIAVGRAFDNKAGTWVTAEAFRLIALSKTKPKCCVIATSSTQEETGLHGAKMLGGALKPDVMIAIDMTHSTDTPDVDQRRLGKVELGKGPSIGIGRENHPEITKRLQKVAKAKKIPVQMEAFSAVGGTDALAVWTLNGGVPASIVSVPNRYMHSTVEMLHLTDMDNCAKLISQFCLDIKKDEQFRVKI